MKAIKFVLLILLSISLSCKEEQGIDTSIDQTTISTFYLIRHAEKDRNTKGKDPVLNGLGLKRAENWAKIFKDIPFDKIYSTDYKRTQQTALPTAFSKG